MLVLFYCTEIPGAIDSANGPADGFICASSTTTNEDQSSAITLKQMPSCTTRDNNLSLTEFNAESNYLENAHDKRPVSCGSSEIHDKTLSGFDANLSMDTARSIKKHFNDFLGERLEGKKHH